MPLLLRVCATSQPAAGCIECCQHLRCRPLPCLKCSLHAGVDGCVCGFTCTQRATQQSSISIPTTLPSEPSTVLATQSSCMHRTVCMLNPIQEDKSDGATLSTFHPSQLSRPSLAVVPPAHLYTHTPAKNTVPATGAASASRSPSSAPIEG